MFDESLEEKRKTIIRTLDYTPKTSTPLHPYSQKRFNIFKIGPGKTKKNVE